MHRSFRSWLILLCAATIAVGACGTPTLPGATGEPVAGTATSTLPKTSETFAAGNDGLIGGTRPSPTSASLPPPTVTPTPFMGIQDQDDALFASRMVLLANWQTNFRNRSIKISEIEDALGKDEIQPIDGPQFVQVGDAPTYMREDEPVVAISLGGEAKAYPLSLLIWHEVINDTISGRPIAVTYCPLCNSAVVFERTVRGAQVSFGTTGGLYRSNLVMYDRQTQSWWLQMTGEAVVGQLTGEKLPEVSYQILSWGEFVDTFARGSLMARPARSGGSYSRPYDDPPYEGYDTSTGRPMLFNTEPDPRLPAVENVAVISSGGRHFAYPFSSLRSETLINDDIGSEQVVLFFDSSVLSPFPKVDSSRHTSGSVTVFRRRLADRVLTFALESGRIVDTETKTTWTVSGRAVEGPLQGAQLAPVPHRNNFWFSWAAFYPETEIRDGQAPRPG